MFFIYLFLVFLVWFGVAIFLTKNTSLDFEFGKITSAVFGIIVMIVFFITSVTSYYDVISIQEDISAISAKKIIYTQQRDELQNQYSTLLDTNYRNYESKIYNKIRNNNNNSQSNVNVNVYPTPQYSNTLIELTNKIQKLNENIYDCDIENQKNFKELRIYDRSIFVLHFLLPAKK